MFVQRQLRHFTKPRSTGLAARIGRCRVWCVIVLYVLTSVVWPFEPVNGSGGCGAKVGRESGCCCSPAKRASGNCCCAKTSKTASLESPTKVLTANVGLTGKRCCAPVVSKASPAKSNSCCKTKTAESPKQHASDNFGWNVCDCPSEPASALAPVFQPRVCPQPESAWIPLVTKAEFVAPTLCWIGAEQEPPTPPPKIVL